MESSKYHITLDLQESHGGQLLTLHQNDTCRRICISLTDGGRPYRLGSGCRGVFTAKKSDGAAIFNDCVIEGDTLIYDITEQTTASCGELSCQLRLYGENGELLSTAAFSAMVYPQCVSDDDVVASTPEATALRSLVEKTTQALDQTTQALDRVEQVENFIDDTAVGEKAWSSKNTADKLCPAFTETGAAVTCEPLEGYPLQVESQLLPAQDGSGDPSPDNVRPITGHTAAKLHLNAQTFTAEFGQTVYGGSLNWNTGALTVTWAALHVKELVNKNNPGVFAQYFMITLPKPADPDRTTEAICSHLRYELNTAATGVFWLGNSGTGLRLLVEGLGTAEEYAAWIAENDPVVAYPLAEPYTIQLPPQEILALSGQNTLLSDTGDITVTGREDPTAARKRAEETLQQHLQQRHAMVGTDEDPIILSQLPDGVYHIRGKGKRWSGDTLRTLSTGFYSVSIFGVSRQMVILPVAGARRIHYSYACETGTHWKDETVYLDSIKTNTEKITKLENAIIALGGDI